MKSSKAGRLDAERSSGGRNERTSYGPARMAASFVPEWWKSGAPDRMKLGTLM
jgi:hypothetical protein